MRNEIEIKTKHLDYVEFILHNFNILLGNRLVIDYRFFNFKIPIQKKLD